MKITITKTLTILTAFFALTAPMSFAQISGAGGSGAAGGAGAGFGVSGTAGGPLSNGPTSGSLNSGTMPNSVAPSTTGNTVNPGGQINNPPILPNYGPTGPTVPNTTAPGLAPLATPAQ
jgi:hypothetical protein